MAGSLAFDRTTVISLRGFAIASVGVLTGACLFAGWFPITFSIVTVFCFAGPHNWLEARYMMSRMPARWGRLRTYFLVGLLGVLLLASLAIAMPHGLKVWRASSRAWLFGVASWNTLLVLWVALLAQLRSREHPRRDWTWVWPVSFAVIALNWLWPLVWSFGLVYLHPLVALWFLDRELGKRRAAWQSTYRKCLAVVPGLLLLLWWRLAAAPDLVGSDALSLQITHHAGGHVFQNVSTHFLVAMHTFLEMIHYGVWIVAIPLVTGSVPWRTHNIPLMRRSHTWKAVLLAVLAGGLCISLFLWSGFLVDYSLTRDIYFTVAILHVLAEVPFLLRLL